MRNLRRFLSLQALVSGLCASLLAVFGAAVPAAAQTYTILYSFTGGVDGAYPYGGMAADAAGNLYGTTGYGGDLNCIPPNGCGTVFKLDPSGNKTILHIFNGADGQLPSGPLLLDASGNLYGTTQTGGGFGAGTVFKVDTVGNFSVVHEFKPAKGMTPYAGVIEDAKGFLYGAAYNGGAFKDGLIYELNPANGQFKTLHSFAGLGDGAAPYGNLTFDGKGGFIGTTAYGGGSCNCGSVFKLDKNGNETVFYTFHFDDGASPFAPVIQDQQGNLYGTTGNGGNFNDCDFPEGCGVIFKLDSVGNITILHTFLGRDGANPNSGVIRDSSGNLYGMTFSGGKKKCVNNPLGCGVIYKLDTSNTLTVLHLFDDTPGDGYTPEANLALDGKGSFIGTTDLGGAFGFGTVFRITP